MTVEDRIAKHGAALARRNQPKADPAPTAAKPRRQRVPRAAAPVEPPTPIVPEIVMPTVPGLRARLAARRRAEREVER